MLKFIRGYEAWGDKTEEIIMNNTFPIFYSPKPRSQVWILIYRNWSIGIITLKFKRTQIDLGFCDAFVSVAIMLKAFDIIDHAILLRKLANYGLDLGSLRFFASYLGNRSQKCCVNGALSSVSELRCGVPQGPSYQQSWSRKIIRSHYRQSAFLV